MGWIVNELPKYIVLALWIGVNLLLFILSYTNFDTGPEFVYLKYLIRDGLPVARGSAAMLNFNCMLILLPVCRNLLSLIHDWPFLPRCICRIMDKNITFHRCVAYMICFATVVHVGSHVFNFESLISSWKKDDVVTQYLNNLDDETPNQYHVNPIRKANLNPIPELLKTVVGITGVVITLCLVVMVSSSTDLIRRSYFEVFWFTHHLFVIFFIGLLFHGFGEMLRAQTNVKEHPPDICVKQVNWSKEDAKCGKVPIFMTNGPQTWKWIVTPMALYLIEKGIRFYRSFQSCEIKKVVKHPSRVIEIQMRKKGFKASAGQYIFLHCPSISQLEWHPFTLTSCPEEDFFSVHIRQAGDWTEALAKSCEDQPNNVDITKISRLACDGPFGTASTDVFHHENVMCVGAGIGVTPFASILKSIWYQHQEDETRLKIKKVYFYWICPETNAFEWFADLLQSLEVQIEEKGNSRLLEYNIYLTRGWGKGDARNIALHDGDNKDVITGLKQKTNYGRPNWNHIFADKATCHPGADIGVFFCGPPVLSHTLHDMCNKHSSESTRFFYNKENF